MEKYTQKLTKVSTHSHSVVIPREIIEKYKWREKQKITIIDKGRGEVVIKDWRNK